MIEKTSQFLSLFNELERYFKELLHEYGEHPHSFKSMVSIAGKKHAFIKSKSESLYDLSDLRNFLVHGYGNSIYADPTDEAIAILGGLLHTLTADKKLQELCNAKPVTIGIHATLSQCLSTMNKHDYSQLPVYDGNTFAGLLNGNIITRWFAANTDHEGKIYKDIDEVSVSGVLSYKEETDSVVFLHRETSVVEFYNVLWERPSKSGVYLLTPNGRYDEIPLGIITYYDIPGIIRELEM